MTETAEPKPLITASQCASAELREKARSGDIEALIEWTCATPEYKANDEPFNFLISAARGPYRWKAARACTELGHNFFNNPGYEELQVLWMAHAGFLKSGRPYKGMKDSTGSWLMFLQSFWRILAYSVGTGLVVWIFIVAVTRPFEYFSVKLAPHEAVTGKVIGAAPHGKGCRIVEFARAGGMARKTTVCGADIYYRGGDTIPLLVSENGDKIVLDDETSAMLFIMYSPLFLLFVYVMYLVGFGKKSCRR